MEARQASALLVVLVHLAHILLEAVPGPLQMVEVAALEHIPAAVAGKGVMKAAGVAAAVLPLHWRTDTAEEMEAGQVVAAALVLPDREVPRLAVLAARVARAVAAEVATAHPSMAL